MELRVEDSRRSLLKLIQQITLMDNGALQKLR
jgi:hypothetical protein